MTPALFVLLALSAAIMAKAAGDLRVPFGPVRRWLAAASYVVAYTDGSEDGKDRPVGFVVVRPYVADSDETMYDTHREALAVISWGDRVKAWAYELVGCPWCLSAWTAAVVVAVAALVESEPGLLVWWPGVWAASGVVVVKGME